MKHTDMMAWLGDLYEGTEFDLTLGLLAGPFGNPFQSGVGGPAAALGQWPRAISQSSTLYSVVAHSRTSAAAEEPILWLAPDTPVSSVYVPFYPSAGESHAPAYSSGNVRNFSRDSAWWAFNFVANWAGAVNWRNASGDSILPLKWKLQGDIDRERMAVEEQSLTAPSEAAAILGSWQRGMQGRVVERWWRLADELIVKYNDGGYTDVAHDKIGIGLGLPLWWAQMIGFDNDVHPIWVKRDREADVAFTSGASLAPPTYVAPTHPLPYMYDAKAAAWRYWSASQQSAAIEEASSNGRWSVDIKWVVVLCTSFLGIGLGIGTMCVRRSPWHGAAYKDGARGLLDGC